MRVRKLITAALGACLSAATLANVNLVSSGGVSQGTIIAEGSTYTLSATGGIKMALNQRYSAFGVNVGNQNWSNYTHLGVTITNNKSAPTLVQVVIDSGTTSRAWTEFMIGANKTRDIVIPFSPAPYAGWQVPASNTEGFGQVQLGGAVTRSSVRTIRIANPLRTGSQDLTLSEMTAISLTTPGSAIIDGYGQQTLSFPGKITSDSQLQAQVTADNLLPGVLPYSSDPYGGVAGSGIDAGTGKWRVAKQNNRWYIITPAGNRFFSTGVVSTGNASLAMTQNREALFAAGALPTQSSPLYQHFVNTTNPETGGAERGFNFYYANLQRKYGTNWQSLADDMMVRRLRSWGFNTLGPSSWTPLYQQSHQLTNMRQTGITGNFKTIPCPGASFPMPDPYDPAWASAVNSTLAPVVAQANSDPNNAGLFVDNEMPWAQHWQEPNYRYDLAFNVLSAASNQPAKQRFYKNLQLKYRTIQKLNAAWATSYASWTAFLNNRNFRPSTPNLALQKDMQEFLTVLATQYFSTIRNKLTALNYKGLYLGCRFAFASPEALAAAARYCHVVSFNCYDVSMSHWRSEMKSLNAPVMVGEFAFAASDRGRVGGGAPVSVTEEDRVEAYKAYIADAKTWPNLVGLHWYKWEDDPVVGRLWDNANHTLGLVSITDVPYDLMVAAATQANTEMNLRLLNP